MTWNPVKRWIVIFFLTSGLTLYFIQIISELAEREALESNQLLTNCLQRASQQLPSCIPKDGLWPEDADYCPDAVEVCKQNGKYAAASLAESKWLQWLLVNQVARIIVAVITVLLAVWWVIVKCIKGRNPHK
jgi:hypothetical protein